MKKLGIPEPDSEVVNKEPMVLLIGYGWVGQYMGKYFKKADIVTEKGWQKHEYDHYDMAIISVPTPDKDGICDTSIVEDCVRKYQDMVDVFLIKSTVEIGTARRLEEKYQVYVCMSPEYIGETLGHPLLEPRRDAFQIIGGTKKACEKVAEMFMKVLHASAPIMIVSHEEAEIIKYCENYWIMRRVDYWNDVMDICDSFGVSFTQVREGIVLDPRMDRTHSNVYRDNRGWAGKCLPKDMNSLANSMRKNGTPLETCEHLITKNKEKWRN